MAKGYIVAELTVSDWEAFRPYRDQAGATVRAYSGRFLVRGGDPVLVEGEDAAGLVVIVEFDSPERVMEWYNSPEYQAILPNRLENANTRLLLATGMPPRPETPG
jgi:uncharacterized protein (DUF1330 family)